MAGPMCQLSMPLYPLTSTVAVADLVVSAALVALMEITLEGTRPGAVYRPAVEIVPRFALPPGMPLTCQLTAVSFVFATVAENCAVWPMVTVAVVGVTVTTTVLVGCGVSGSPLRPPQPTKEITEHRAMSEHIHRTGFKVHPNMVSCDVSARTCRHTLPTRHGFSAVNRNATH